MFIRATQRAMCPQKRLPAARSHDTTHAASRIYCKRMSYRSEHPAIERGIAIRAALRERNLPRIREFPDRARFDFAKHRNVRNAAAPAIVANFKLRCDH